MAENRIKVPLGFMIWQICNRFVLMQVFRQTKLRDSRTTRDTAMMRMSADETGF